MDRDFYTPTQAARILGVTDRHVRHMLADEELEGDQSDTGRWKIPQREVHRLLQERRDKAEAYGSQPAGESAAAAQEAAELRARLEGLQRSLGRLEGRLELTEQAESTLREQLERERELADKDREYLQSQLEEAHGERRRLQEELEEARQDAVRPWWRRMFGG